MDKLTDKQTLLFLSVVGLIFLSRPLPLTIPVSTVVLLISADLFFGPLMQERLKKHTPPINKCLKNVWCQPGMAANGRSSLLMKN